jgi:hypothetical protein
VAELDLQALVRNRTMSPEVAALLQAIGREQRSFLTLAVPRLAGKSTVMAAVLENARGGTPIRVLDSNRAFLEAAQSQPEGYLVIPEVSPYAAAPGYLWGEPVRRAFELTSRGYALATALHAPGVAEAFEELCAGCGVPDELASRLEFTIYIRSLGPWQRPRRRVVAQVHQVFQVHNGVPEARLLHRWDEASDRFEVEAPPEGLSNARALSAAARAFGEPAGEA